MSLTSIPPGSTAPTDIVSQKIFVNGSVISNELLLARFTVQKAFNKVGSVKIVFVDGSVADRDFALSNEDLFKPGQEIRLELGYDGDTDVVFEGIIVKHGIKIAEHGSALLLVEAKDKAIKLTAARKSRYFLEKTDSDLLNELINDSGLQPEVDTTNFQHKQMVQYECTDWDFIVSRAEANSMLVLTDDGKVVVKKPSTLSVPVASATYGSNILEFEAEMDARRQVQNVTASSWSVSNFDLESSDDGTADFTEPGNISAADLGSVLGAAIRLSHTGDLSAAQLQDWADAYAMHNKLSKAAGRVRIQGNAGIKPGNMLTLSGVGDRFNGNVFVTGVLHHFQGTWHTDVQFGWSEDWFYKKEDVMNKAASGLLPGVNGLQIGKVSAIDNDPEHNYRVKVHVPTITSSNEGIWARVATLDAGMNRGIYFRPEVGDEVLLGFVNDDPRSAVVLGCMHNKDSKVLPFKENEEFGMVTKEKLKIILDDTHKKITLSVETEAGAQVIVLNNSGAMELTDGRGNSIKMSGSGINIESSGNVVIKGTMVNIN